MEYLVAFLACALIGCGIGASVNRWWTVSLPWLLMLVPLGVGALAYLADPAAFEGEGGLAVVMVVLFGLIIALPVALCGSLAAVVGVAGRRWVMARKRNTRVGRGPPASPGGPTGSWPQDGDGRQHPERVSRA